MQTLDFAACLFDMDGTLIDTEPYWIEAENRLVAEHGGRWSAEQGLALVGNGLWESAQVLQDAGVDMDQRQIIDWLSNEVKTRMVEAMPWRPGVLTLLNSLRERDISLALVTMSFREMATTLAGAVSSELGGEVFGAVVCGEDVDNPKPHPEPYLTAASHLGVNIRDCVAFEDSRQGATSAYSAGAVTIGLPLHVEIPTTVLHTVWESMENKTPDDINQVFHTGRVT